MNRVEIPIMPSYGAQMPAEAEKVRVSILERLVPAAALGLLAFSGVVGAFHFRRVIAAMRQAENAGIDAFYAAMAEVFLVLGSLAAVAALFGVIGLIVSAARMFTTNTKASPPGFLFLIPAFFCFLPPLLADGAASLAIQTVSDPGGSGVSGVAGKIDILTWAAIGTSLLAFLVLAAFAFIPFSAKPARRYSPVIFLLVIEGAMLLMAGGFFVVMRICLSRTEYSFF